MSTRIFPPVATFIFFIRPSRPSAIPLTILYGKRIGKSTINCLFCVHQVRRLTYNCFHASAYVSHSRLPPPIAAGSGNRAAFGMVPHPASQCAQGGRGGLSGFLSALGFR